MKQLDLNVDKSATIIFGNKKRVTEIRNFIEENKSLAINGEAVQIKDQEKYLGDYFHSGGLAKCVEVTIKKRYGAALASIIEVKSVIEDFRMHKLGGISSGVNIFHMAILPALLNNAETWIQAPNTSIGRLDNLQNILMRCLLAVPNSTPIPALNWDLGLVSMEHQINQKKLMFLHYLTNLDNKVLAKEIFTVQKESKLPGFVPEVRNLISLYGLPDILDNRCVLSKERWAKLVKDAIKKCYEAELKVKMAEGYSKLKNSNLV